MDIGANLAIPLAFILFPFKWFGRQMRGQPYFLPPVQLNSDDKLVWWYLPIEIGRSFFGCGTIKNCQSFLIRHWEYMGDPPPGEGLHLAWFSNGEYKESLTLETGYIYYIPIAQRTEDETGRNAIITHVGFHKDQNKYKWERDQRSEFHLEIRTKFTRIKGPTYTMWVPPKGESNAHFWIQLWRPDLLSG